MFPGRFAVTIDGATTEWKDPDGLVGRAGLAHEAVAIAEFIALATTLDTVRSALHEQEPIT